MSRNRAGFALSAISAVALIGLVCWLIPATRSVAQDAPLPPGPLPDSGPAVPAPDNVDSPGQQVLTNGPVHEAYAEPTNANPGPPIVVPKEPPPPVQEMPPDVKPDGQNVVWIPGYWAWDDGRQNFIWVSGIWRDTPPNHSWVSGYWNSVSNGWQWTPGLWAPSNVEQVNYVPQPPQSLEAGPNTPAPTPNDFWVPGNYEYVDANWAWRPGYWTAAQPGWIWVPSHFVWTPSGYLFIRGHWDYELAHRGVLFAPVAFNFDYWGPRPIYYGPAVVIDPGVLTVDFFVRPGYYHYYFGDCYGPAYVGWGFRPWFSVGIGFDPIFTYYRWYNVRRDPGWAIRVSDRYAYMDRHPDARPPRTFAMSVRVGAPGGVRIGVTLTDFARRPGGPVRFQTVSMAERQQFAREAVRSNEVARQRAFAESHNAGRPGARSLDMHAMAQASGGHLPGSTTNRTTADRSFESTSRGTGANNAMVRPGPNGTTTPINRSTTPQQSHSLFSNPFSRTPQGSNGNSNKKQNQNQNQGNNGGGRNFVQPDNDSAMNSATPFAAPPLPPNPFDVAHGRPSPAKGEGKLAAGTPANQPRTSLASANQSSTNPAQLSQQGAVRQGGSTQAQQIYPGFDTFGGLISANAANRAGLLISNPALAASQNVSGSATLPPQTSSNDPIMPLTLAPGLSQQFSPQMSQPGSPDLPAQLAQFGNNAAALTSGQTGAAELPLPQSALLQQVGNPGMRTSATDPIRPLTLVPTTALPIGNSATGLPGAPVNYGDSISQKDPVRPLTLVPPGGNGS